jgi:hypothetical protein
LSCLDRRDVIVRQFDFGLESSVKGRHQRGGNVAVRETQRMPELVSRRLQQVGAWTKTGKSLERLHVLSNGCLTTFMHSLFLKKRQRVFTYPYLPIYTQIVIQ